MENCIKSGIYKITSPTGRVYIGQSINIDYRFRQYKNLKKIKKQVRLYNSLNKYGTENHTFEIIEECQEFILNDRERYWQDFYDVTGKNGLNCSLTESKDKRRKLSESTKLKISRANTGNFHTLESIELMSINRKGKGSRPGKSHPLYGKRGKDSFNFGRSHSDEVRVTFSIAKTGEKNPMYGKKHSEETKEKMRSNNARYWAHNEYPKDVRRGYTSSFKGKKHTEESKAKMRGKRASLSNGKNPKATLVLNTETGVFYECIKFAAESCGVNPKQFKRRINQGRIPFIYC